MCVYMYMCMYIYIYIYRERERYTYIIYVCVYIYIYIYTCSKQTPENREPSAQPGRDGVAGRLWQSSAGELDQESTSCFLNSLPRRG